MLYSIKPPLLLPLFFSLTLFLSGNLSLAHNSELIGIKRRILMGIKETPNGGNVTFDCSPSGPCIPCLRAEKNDEKYRCGETGYRIRLKCVPIGSGSKDSKSTKEEKKRSTLEFTELGINEHDGDLIISSTRQRRLLGDSSKGGPRAYITYRSCIPAVNEEKLSVLGFEALMLALLISSGSFIYFRRRRAAAPGGVPVRLPTSSRF
ncbi:hypothetical protein C2S53_002685 [Perilla frutescens var. hirtella]|uniref:Uncharacterized protein n=1 Tax=Perilla frutescens var. hirtella TaxID=608512 RepID=A0AAD4IP97_PERFH|nr:hypothetical protein C2S53_002685 [Perilla frutescens var. hirtella]KAH6809527.1 hypothetical protein C2S51_027310 [Perilla frutescens var. frutescens]